MDLYQLIDASQEPILRTHDWIQEAKDIGVGLPHALNLASVSSGGQPSSRMVLLKRLSDEGLVFFTDYDGKKGQEIREAYVSAIEGLADLLGAVSHKATQGHIMACDGRRVLVDSPHKGLNYLLQCSAGVVAKRWMVIANDLVQVKASQLAFVHDELQYECEQDYADTLMETLENSAKLAGHYYNLRCPIAAEAKKGKTWADVH